MFGGLHTETDVKRSMTPALPLGNVAMQLLTFFGQRSWQVKERCLLAAASEEIDTRSPMPLRPSVSTGLFKSLL